MLTFLYMYINVGFFWVCFFFNTKFGNLWQVCLLRLQHSFNSETVLPTECSYITIWIRNHNQNPSEIKHKTRNQLREKREKNDFMDTKWHASKKKGGVSEKIETEFKNTLRQMTMKTQLYKRLWDAAKVVLRGKFIQYRAFSKKKKKLKQTT